VLPLAVDCVAIFPRGGIGHPASPLAFGPRREIPLEDLSPNACVLLGAGLHSLRSFFRPSRHMLVMVVSALFSQSFMANPTFPAPPAKKHFFPVQHLEGREPSRRRHPCHVSY